MFFQKSKKKYSFLNKFINKLPFELHLPGHNFTGPGTKLKKRLNNNNSPKKWSKPINRVDEIAMQHDICYSKFPDTKRRHICDQKMIIALNKIKKPLSIREKIDRAIVKKIILTKMKMKL